MKEEVAREGMKEEVAREGMEYVTLNHSYTNMT